MLGEEEVVVLDVKPIDLHGVIYRDVTVTFPDDRVYKFQARQQCNNFGPISAPTITFAQVPTEGNTAGAALVPAGGGSALTDGSIPGPLNLIDFGANIYNPTVFTLTTAEEVRSHRELIDR